MNRPERPNWEGRTVVCIASGPSLTAEDVEKVRQSGHPVIVTNTTFRLAPWADVVFGMDMKWWNEHHKEVAATCTGRKMSTSLATRAYGAECLHQVPWFTRTLNSGEGAIRLALVGKAKRIVLLGFDCQRTGGKSHFFGDHPVSLGNCKSMPNWPRFFKHAAKEAERLGIPVVNCSRETALTCFQRIDLEAALKGQLNSLRIG